MTAAKKKIPLLKSSFFWNKIADVMGLFGTGGLITLSETDADKKWSLIVGIATGLVQFIRLFFADNNRNNIPDILEDQEAEVQQEVNITVKPGPEGGAPIVDVTQQTTTLTKEPEK
jgi:hypothetical protein